MDDARARKLAENEALAREVNEQVEKLAARWNESGEQIELICECSHETCTVRVHVTLTEYYQVRKHPDRFVVTDDHVLPEIERRVGEVGDATVVEKIGPGRAVAAATA